MKTPRGPRRPLIVPEPFLGGRVNLWCGDCLEVLKEIPAASLDSCVSDPPYHLTSIVKRFGAENAAPAKAGKTGAYARASAGFMGKQWDGGDIAFRPEIWAEVLRVLKPGGHLVAFGGTRTYHRMACAIEDAGFEIRDQIGWAYGSGFPKSHDVSKGIDKRRDEDEAPVRAVCRYIRTGLDRKGLKSRHLVDHFDGCHPRLIDHWAARDTDSQPALPTWPQWLILKAVLEFDGAMDVEVWRLNGRKGEPSDGWKEADVIGEHDGVPGGFGDHRFSVRDDKIRTASIEASGWQGWGTALKPAWEPVCLARKPLDGGLTVASNVIKWGTGAINVDACRVHSEDSEGYEYTVKRTMPGAGQNKTGDRKQSGVMFSGKSKDGRWPANVVHDGSDEVVAAFPAEAGAFAPVHGTEPSNSTVNVYGARDRTATFHHGDSGSAARFFYTAKADSDDRIGSKHPTVKPVDLMQWLVRLVTPPGGVVLDPFAGTGTTGEAAWREGFRAVLIERETEYQEDIRRRMALCLSGPDERAREAIKAKMKGKPIDAGPLFGGTE